MQRFFISPESIQANSVFLEDKEIIHQLTKVLRIQTNDQIILLDNTGAEYLTELTEIRKTTIQGKIIEQHQNTAEPRIKITLFQALPKNPAKFEQVLQHGTEIGIAKFVPILTERTEVQKIRNRERLERIVRESAEQSERGLLPEITELIAWKDIWHNPPKGLNLVADSYCSKPLLKYLLPKINSEEQTNLGVNSVVHSKVQLNIFIGPEGGFTKTEIKTAVASGAQNFSLGPRILRTETAGLSTASTILFS